LIRFTDDRFGYSFEGLNPRQLAHRSWPGPLPKPPWPTRRLAPPKELKPH
jgi:hypothetical protein